MSFWVWIFESPLGVDYEPNEFSTIGWDFVPYPSKLYFLILVKFDAYERFIMLAWGMDFLIPIAPEIIEFLGFSECYVV